MTPSSIPLIAIMNMNAIKINQIEDQEKRVIATGLSNFDEALGGGLATGTLTLFAGESGAGKSTIVLQICNHVACSGKTVLYVTCEQSVFQLKDMANRLGVVRDNLWVMDSKNYQDILNNIAEINPALIVIDSLQTIEGDFGRLTVGTIKYQEKILKRLHDYMGENKDKVMVVINQFTKSGDFAGSNYLKHIVDNLIVIKKVGGDERSLYIEKARFAPQSSSIVLRMTAGGLIEPNAIPHIASVPAVEVGKDYKVSDDAIKKLLSKDRLFSWAINDNMKLLFKRIYGEIEAKASKVVGFDIIFKTN